MKLKKLQWAELSNGTGWIAISAINTVVAVYRAPEYGPTAHKIYINGRLEPVHMGTTQNALDRAELLHKNFIMQLFDKGE